MSTVSSAISSLPYSCALIPFITAGNPNIQSTENILKLLDNSGADVIEIGLPYSDPLADGPVIQEASQEALKQGMNFDVLLGILHQVNGQIRAPLVLFTYYNPVVSRGVLSFVKEIAAAGIKGIIIPDLPLEEADYLLEICNTFSIELILLVTPTSSPERIESIIDKSQGVIYIVSSTGVTGMRKKINSEMKEFIQSIKAKTNKLIIMGFGISQKKHVEQIIQWDVDGIVIGSAFVNCLADPNVSEGLSKLQSLCQSMKDTIIDV
uniref:Tryptophan synthase alpha chain n=1 Tax=Liagora brachyclada TaxID=1884665 RepID=A0A1G4NZN5_9FLOR|nr:Tryptophan synthase alpha subunit [Liagora brachyclada]SCW24151.1 Tryptophan synthase alpha subunit [Liagora brachyclada]